ncbi:histidinol-phosphate transaminase [Desulfobacula phenolica]|uniref:Histidinol-phosphate aminotransferase n=1 Tax=Desulfobacula phenolica TaxID=90732 RepID=A0A1H2JY85_9BACT|nr:histidinol-phosphate transaminase [Desulfobacula phenolica]SDU61116.1 histidinol-phosphate aminotransferase [Desulfobacula phenolica]
MKFKVSEQIATIKPYVAGKPLKEVEREYHISNPIKLASNENPIGFSPKVYDAVSQHMKDMNRYPESSAYVLNNKLAKKFHITPQNIVLGNGSDDIIALLAHGFLNPGDEALMPLPSFLMYEISVKTAKGVPVMVPLADFATNLEGLVDSISSKTRLIFITNPFNPTGSTITCDEFNEFSQNVPDDVIIVVDEAYIEFVRDDAVYNSLKNPLQDPRVVTLRTFSKAYGLAGFRVGYGIMDSQIAEILNRIRQPFNVNSLAQVAAVAALDDEAFLNKSIRTTHDGLDFLFDELAGIGIRCLPTQSNFLMLDLEIDATQVFEQMLKLGVIVRSMSSYGYDTFLRVNTGTKEENIAFIQALKKVLKK